MRTSTIKNMTKSPNGQTSWLNSPRISTKPGMICLSGKIIPGKVIELELWTHEMHVVNY